MEIAAVVALFALAFTALLLSLRALALTGIPVRSSSGEAVEAALDLLALADGETFCDLGCGTGGVLRSARRRARVRAIGYELNPFAASVAAIRGLFDRRLRVRPRDFRRARLGEPDAVYAYLMPRAMPEVGELLEAELCPGARFVSVDFPVPGWKPKAVREVGPLRQPIYLYVLGEHRG